MPRIVRIASAQMGPNQRADSRAAILARMVNLLEEAAARGVTLVVFPELAFTTFFRPLAARGRGWTNITPAMPNPWQGKEKMFNFAAHRQPAQYSPITACRRC